MLLTYGAPNTLQEDFRMVYYRNANPPSLIIALGIPNLENMFSLRNFNTTLWSFVFQATTSIYLDT